MRDSLFLHGPRVKACPVFALALWAFPNPNSNHPPSSPFQLPHSLYRYSVLTCILNMLVAGKVQAACILNVRFDEHGTVFQLNEISQCRLGSNQSRHFFASSLSAILLAIDLPNTRGHHTDTGGA